MPSDSTTTRIANEVIRKMYNEKKPDGTGGGLNKTMATMVAVLATGTLTSVIQAIGRVMDNTPTELVICLDLLSECHEGVREISKLCIGH